MSSSVVATRHGGVCELRMDRAAVHNAFDDQLIAELTNHLQQIDEDASVRAVVLTGSGTSFSAGADMNWMRAMAGASEADNRDDSLRLAKLMRTLQFLSKPTLARVNGAAFGGGVGLVACCDIAISVDSAKFGLTEVKLGLVPAVISPYVVAAIGLRESRRLFATGEIIDANEAMRIGLLHRVVDSDGLDSAVSAQLAMLAKAGPCAVVHAKALALRIGGQERGAQERIDADNAALIAALRVSTEGQEGLSAFLEKRRAAWLQSPAT